VRLGAISAAMFLAWAQAQEPDTTGPGELEPRLHLSFTPYLWAVNLTGDSAVAGVSADVDVSFFDVLDEADRIFGLSGALEFQYGRAFCQLNDAYMRLDKYDIGGSAGPVSVDIDVEVHSNWLELAGGWRFIEQDLGKTAAGDLRWMLDGLVGARVTDLEVEGDLTAAVMVTLPDGTVLQANERRLFEEDKDWVEPFFGARAIADLGEHFSFSLRGDIGGFGAGSDLSWQTIAAAGYRTEFLGIPAVTFFGYRALGQDFEDGDFEWDIIAHGPMLGFQMRF